MSMRVQYGGPHDAGGTGSGTGPGIDFVSALFSTTSLDDIEVLIAREAESRFGLNKLRLHWTATTAGSSPLTDDTHAVVPLHTRRPAPDKWPFQFELAGTPPGTWMAGSAP